MIRFTNTATIMQVIILQETHCASVTHLYSSAEQMWDPVVFFTLLCHVTLTRLSIHACLTAYLSYKCSLKKKRPVHYDLDFCL